MSRTAYIIIHGNGGGLIDTVSFLSEVASFKAHWFDGTFYVRKNTGQIIRKILAEGDDASPLFEALQKLAVGNLLKACENPSPIKNGKDYTTFRELQLMDDFTNFCIPFGPALRNACSLRLIQEGKAELLSLFSQDKNSSLANLVQKLSASLKEDDALLSEDHAADVLAASYTKPETVEDLKLLRDMGESGADLDSISSATFYAHALTSQAKKEKREFKYGPDFKFAYVYYHIGLKGLAETCSPGDIYLADIPIGTIPDLPGDLEFLKEHDLHLKRYEDHHPYTSEHLEMLNELKGKGLIGYFKMTGPMQGEPEPPEEELKCGGDMVYEALIEGKKYDNPAMAFLKELVHEQDLAQGSQEQGKILTELIKGGVNSFELVQLLLNCQEKNDIQKQLDAKGWYERIKKERELVESISERFMENIQIMEIDRPEMGDAALSGPAFGPGSDMPVPLSKRKKDHDRLSILLVLSPYSKKGEPKLKIGRAQEYFAKTMPAIDYLFYCYGSSIIVSRRLNQADTSLNLSELMKKLGTESDGGHAGAAVCCPENNPNYPKHILGHVNSANFAIYCRYLSDRIEKDFKVKVHSRRDISVKNSSDSKSKGTRNLIILVAAAIAIGLLVIFFNPAYRQKEISENNKTFFPWIEEEPEPIKNSEEQKK